jgi:hypothetical protein
MNAIPITAYQGKPRSCPYDRKNKNITYCEEEYAGSDMTVCIALLLEKVEEKE